MLLLLHLSPPSHWITWSRECRANGWHWLQWDHMLESVTLLFLPRQSSRKTCLGLHPFHCYCPFVSPIRHQNPSLDTWTSQRRCIFWIDQVKTGFCYLHSGYFLSKHLLQSSSPHHVRKHWSNAPKRGWVSGHISMHACLFSQRIWFWRWIHILHRNPHLFYRYRSITCPESIQFSWTDYP